MAILATVASFSLNPVSAQQPEPVTVEAKIDKERVTVGDRVTLTLTVRHAPDVVVDTPSIPALPSDLEMLEVLAPQEEQSNGQRLVHWRYILAAFAPGQVLVPPITVRYSAGGSTSTITSNPTPVNVESVIPPGTTVEDIRDLKGQMEIPGGPPLAWQPLAMGAAVAVATVVLWPALRAVYRRRQMKPFPPLAPGPSLSPEDIAQAELGRLRESMPPGQGEYKRFYQSLAHCIRRYLQDRHAFPATALTAGELEERMIAQGIDRWQARLVGNLLSECDKVMYTGYVPPLARLEGDLRLAYEIVELPIASVVSS